MKTPALVLALAGLALTPLFAQVAASGPALSAPAEVASGYEVVERDAHSRVWARANYETNALGGVTARTNRFTELQTGLHYRSGDQWLVSEAKIELLPNNSGAVAARGQHRAIFPPEIKSGLIELALPDGQWLRSRIWGLSYFDPTTGQSVLLAEVKGREAVLVGDNMVIYPDCFTSVRATARYTYTVTGFEQDVVWETPPPAPEAFGLNPRTTRLQVLTEFVEAPTPARISRSADGLADDTLGFGAMSIGAGNCFSVDAAGDPIGEVPVAKAWIRMAEEGRNFLVEEVLYQKVADQLQALPPAEEYQGASLQRRGRGENVIAGLKALLPQRYAKAALKSGLGRIAQVQSKTVPGFVMDYVVSLNGQANATLECATTYYVGATVNLTGTTTIEGGTVVKYTNTSAARINFTGPLVCQTSAYRPAVFTSKDDDSVGETISGSNHNPVKSTVNKYLVNGGAQTNTYSYLRLAYAGTALDDACLKDVWHCQLLHRNLGIYTHDADILLRNVLFVGCSTGVKTTENVNGEHLTVDGCNRFADSKVSGGSLVNSILTAVTTVGSVSLASGSVNLASGSGVYQTVGAGSYYLAASSTNRNAGTTSITPTLLAALPEKTTSAPLLLGGSQATDTTLNPQAQRDSDTPDRGFHYDPIDYVVSSVTLSSGQLSLADGVVVGTSPGANTNAGIIFLTGSGKLVAEGSPTRRNRLVRYPTVQEGSPTTAVNNASLVAVDSSATTPEIRCRFTDWLGLSGSGDHLTIYNVDAPFSFADGQFHGGRVFLKGTPVGLTNCLWERVQVSLNDDGEAVDRFIYNSLFKGGTLTLVRNGTGACQVRDTLFDRTTNAPTGTITHDHNGYVANYPRLTPNGSGDVILAAAPSYQTGPLGSFYYPSNGSLTNLLNAGSRSAPSAGLYHYTTTTNQVKETNSTVDIGFHYVAMDGSGQPVDTDTDGLADYFEDTNGNGAYDTGDLADLNAPDTDDDQMPDGWEWQHFGTFSRDGTGDYDDDGVDDLAEFNAGSDPNSIQFYTLFANLSVSGDIATGMVTVLAGVPAKIAVQADPNLAVASWSAYRSNFVADIRPTDGVYVVYVGIKGQADTSEATWAGYQLTRDTSSPMAVITNPATGIVSQPRIQLQGYSPEPLARVRYDLTNANGSLTNLEGYVVKQSVDTNTFAITTNWFACLELNLAVGTNQVTLRVTDRAGNVTTTNLQYVFVYPTNAPMLSLVWPQDGDLLSGTSFTLRGRLSDPTAQLTAEVVGEGVTHSMTGIVERDGKFWIENVPLATGTNQVTISVTDVGTNSTTTNFAVVKSGVELTIDALNPSELNDPYITVSGSINVSTHRLWVNGMEVTNVSSGTWYVEGVPLNEDGTATIQARAIPTSDNGGHGTGGGGGENSTFDDPGNPQSEDATTLEANADKPAAVVMVHYQRNRSYLSLTRDESPTKKQTTEIIKWDVQQPGSWFDDYCGGITSGGHMYYVCRSRQWESDDTGTLKSWEDRGGEEVCGVQLYGAPTPYTLAGTWPGESCWTKGYRVTAGGGLGKDEVVARTAHTLYELHTGGKQLSGRKNLFVLSGGAEGVGNPFWPEDDNDKKSYVIPNTSVLLGDIGYLDSDGKIYPVLPDGQTRDVTPRVEGSPYYTFGEPVPSKHGLELVSPSGNPTNAPSAPDRLCFTAESPGVLTVNFLAVLTNNGPAWAVTNRVRFEADEISGSTPTWSPDHPGGQPTASGSALFATLYYTNLPANNSAFGLKFGRVRLDGEVHDEKCFWAFYDADAFNYPGCRPWLTYYSTNEWWDELDLNDKARHDHYRSPNYFFFYMQTAARYGSPLFDYHRSHQTRPWEYCPPQHTNYYVEVREDRSTQQAVPSPGANGGQVLNYIDRFAWACRHEARHSENYVAWWGSQCYSQTNDVDVWDPPQSYGDAIPNWVEPNLPDYAGQPYSPTNPCTHGHYPDLGEGDDQLYTCLTAQEWTPIDTPRGDPNDWAKPGKNWPE